MAIVIGLDTAARVTLDVEDVRVTRLFARAGVLALALPRAEPPRPAPELALGLLVGHAEVFARGAGR